MAKSINISDELHQQLKLYAVQHGTTVKSLVESSIRNTISQKPSASEIDKQTRSLKDLILKKPKGDMPFDL